VGQFALTPALQSYPVTGIGRGLAIDSSGTIYAGAGNTIQMYNSSFSYVKNFGSFGSINGMVFDSTGLLYVLDSGNSKVCIFDSNQNQVGSFSCGSSGGSSYSMAINNQNEIFITDPNNYLIKVFSTNGTSLRQWGSNGILNGQFPGPPSQIAITADSKVNVLTDRYGPYNNWNTGDWGPYRDGGVYGFQFDRYGNYTGGVGIDNGREEYLMTCSPDGYFVAINNNTWKSVFMVNPPNNWWPNNNWDRGGAFNTSWFGGIAFMPNGDMVMSDTVRGCLWVLKRIYYGRALPPTPTAAPPLPSVVNFSQRIGTTFVDIDYKVISTNSSSLGAGVLAFVNGQQDLNHLIIPTTFAENTQSNLGTNISPNTPYHLTWNAAADWSTNTGSIQIEVLAQDGRPLQPQSWTYSPTNLPAKLTGTVTDPWSMWLWLLAIHDPSVYLKNRTIVGVGGSYDGQVLVNNGTSTTSAGQQFLQDRVNAQVPLIESNSLAH